MQDVRDAIFESLVLPEQLRRSGRTDPESCQEFNGIGENFTARLEEEDDSMELENEDDSMELEEEDDSMELEEEDATNSEMDYVDESE